MNCGEVKNLIQLYMDNELDARNTLDVQQHMESCSVCSRLLDVYLKQDQALKEFARSEAVNSGPVRARILAAIHNQSSETGKRWPFLAIWKRVAAVAAMVIVVALLLWRGVLLPGINERVYAAAISDHADHCSFEMVTGAITDRDELDKLSGVYGKLNATPDLSAFGYANPRGRVCKMNGSEFLHLVFYNQEKQGLSVFLRPHYRGFGEHKVTLLEESSYRVAAVSRSGIDLLVVSSLDEKQASAIAESIAAEL